jgi:enamine deaminase RidA (YjgF/YER057c/UK114 family)
MHVVLNLRYTGFRWDFWYRLSAEGYRCESRGAFWRWACNCRSRSGCRRECGCLFSGCGCAETAPSGPFGKVGGEVSPEEAYVSARLTALNILADLKRELGDLDRVTAWLRVFGMVNTVPGFTGQPAVINGFSDLIIELYGPEAGQHARSAVGMADLPMGLPVEIEAEVEIAI